MSTTPPTNMGKTTEKSMEQVPNDVRKMTEQSMEQVRTAIDSHLQFLKRAVPGNVMGGNELSDKVLNYAERMTEQVKDLSETSTKAVMDAVKGVGGPRGEGGASS